MYITQTEWLGCMLRERIPQQKEICSKIDKWIFGEYGIPNFSEMRSSFFGLKPKETTLVLCRQIPSATVENLACHVISKILHLPIIYPSFTEDQFYCNNKEKKSYLHLLWADRGKKKTLFFNGDRIVDGRLDNWNGVPLSKIRTTERVPGVTVPDFHYSLRRKIFGENDSITEVSEFSRLCVRHASKKPNEVFVYEEDRVHKRNIRDVDISKSNFRPTADWYYPLFHSWFLDGSMVMLENYEDDGEGKGAQVLFENAVRKTKNETGFAPLVLKTSSHDRLLAIPRKFIESPHALQEIEKQFSEGITGNFTLIFESVADAIFDWVP